MNKSEAVRLGPMTPAELRLINSLTPAERKEALLAIAKQKFAEAQKELQKAKPRPAMTISDEEASQLSSFYSGVEM